MLGSYEARKHKAESSKKVQQTYTDRKVGIFRIRNAELKKRRANEKIKD